MRTWMTALLLLGSGLACAEPVCELIAVSGDALLGSQPAAVGQKLEPGAELRTGAGGRVKLRFVDGSVLVLADNSQMRIDAFSASPGQPRQASIWLQLGLIGQKVTPSSGGSWQVRTPTAVTAVRGTEFFVEIAADQATAVHVKSGEVAVESTIKTRGIRPHQPVRLAPQLNGTRCDARGDCVAASAWPAERVAGLANRVGSLD